MASKNSIRALRVAAFFAGTLLVLLSCAPASNEQKPKYEIQKEMPARFKAIWTLVNGPNTITYNFCSNDLNGTVYNRDLKTTRPLRIEFRTFTDMSEPGSSIKGLLELWQEDPEMDNSDRVIYEEMSDGTLQYTSGPQTSDIIQFKKKNCP